MKITDKHIFFWNGIYSQWYPSKFKIDNISYNSCEQYMMHQKALSFGDTEIATQILLTEHPDEQKKLGKLVNGFDRTIWDQHCFSIVYRGNYAKFTQNEDLKQQLLATGDKILVEASPYDFIWGIKQSVDDTTNEDPANWRGLNLLGFSIMTVRNQIK
jgi:ribA/ribD-fused uncharacterized protein